MQHFQLKINCTYNSELSMHLRTEKVKDLISKLHQYYRQKMIQLFRQYFDSYNYRWVYLCNKMNSLVGLTQLSLLIFLFSSFHLSKGFCMYILYMISQRCNLIENLHNVSLSLSFIRHCLSLSFVLFLETKQDDHMTT